MAIGIVVGGKISDVASRRFGSSGRLVPVYLGCILDAVAGAGLGFSAKYAPIWSTLLIAFAVGLGLTIARPGLFTFAIERRPQSPSALSAALISCQFLLCFVGLLTTPFVIQRVGYDFFFVYLAGFILMTMAPLSLMTLHYWGYGRIPADFHEPNKH